MFVNAIKTVGEFTKPIVFITRFYGSTKIQPGLAALFFVNAEGWAMTCRHVVNEILGEQVVAKRRKDFETDLASIKGKISHGARKKIEAKHGLNSNEALELKAMFGFGDGSPTTFTYHNHPTHDVALMRFHNFSNDWCTTFPTFGLNAADLEPGKTICRLGFPFPEFTNFAYDPATDSIDWGPGDARVPRFPIDGMVSRHVLDGGKITGFELTTPGLRGQSGGPAFDRDGKIWGMQSGTCHLDLNFDIEQDVLRRGKEKRVTSYPFLHVGRCVHVDILKDFMRQHKVAFSEA